ncbi:MAG: MmcB family DNA repair protein [Hyphomicrobium sp.]
MTAADEPLNRRSDTAAVAARDLATALDIRRGVMRVLAQHGLAGVAELPLANGRRADVAALTAGGEVWIVEIKSSVADFRADQKWPEYRDYADRLFFAVQPDFPINLLPSEAGLILADRFGGEVVRSAPEHRITAARRKAMALRFARAAALRLALIADPSLPLHDDEAGNF